MKSLFNIAHGAGRDLTPEVYCGTTVARLKGPMFVTLTWTLSTGKTYLWQIRYSSVFMKKDIYYRLSFIYAYELIFVEENETFDADIIN